MASLFGRGFDSLQVHDDYFKPLIFQRFFYISLFVKNRHISWRKEVCGGFHLVFQTSLVCDGVIKIFNACYFLDVV